MELDEAAKIAVKNLGKVINSAVEQSAAVHSAIENLREIGFEPNLMLKLEIALQKIDSDAEDFDTEVELNLTDEDVRTLRRMKIKL